MVECMPTINTCFEVLCIANPGKSCTTYM
jgi:hypothetical protein